MTSDTRNVELIEAIAETVLHNVEFQTPSMIAPCSPFEFYDDYTAEAWARALVHVMKTINAPGLALPQIGFNTKMIALSTNPILVLINPKIVTYSTERSEREEKSFTFPGLCVSITRSDAVKCRFYTPDAKIRTENFDREVCSTLLPLMDLLDGIPFFHTASRLKVERALKKSGCKRSDVMRFM